MIYRNLTLSLFLLLASSLTCAASLPLNPTHPQQYTVVKGDTLWDIAAKFLQNPWQWPELWEKNQHIKNPHLIYPGETLYFSLTNGRPSISLTPPGQVKIDPQIRLVPINEEISVIPTDAIRQFLASPKVVEEGELNQAPYVIAFAGEHLVAGAGDRLYARAIIDPNSLDYTVFRKGNAYIDPTTGEDLGYEAIHIADTRLQKTGDPATLLITESKQEVRIGDRLMISASGELALTYLPRPPATKHVGKIISVLNGVTQIGRHSIVVINKGTSDGIETGHIFDIYQSGDIVKDPFIRNQQKTGMVKLPDEIAGILMVFRPFSRVSYALVMEANSAIHILDTIKTP